MIQKDSANRQKRSGISSLSMGATGTFSGAGFDGARSKLNLTSAANDRTKADFAAKTAKSKTNTRNSNPNSNELQKWTETKGGGSVSRSRKKGKKKEFDQGAADASEPGETQIEASYSFASTTMHNNPRFMLGIEDEIAPARPQTKLDDLVQELNNFRFS